MERPEGDGNQEVAPRTGDGCERGQGFELCDTVAARTISGRARGGSSRVLAQDATIGTHASHGSFAIARLTPLQELGIKTDDVISCNETDRAIDVFSTMSKNGVSALPILDEEGCFTNVVSASDLKGIGEDCSSFYRLAQNIIDYISPLRQANLKSKYPAISCTLDHTLGQLIQKLNASRIHRVFVVDENKHVVGIASLGDVLRVIYEAILRISPDPPEVETL